MSPLARLACALFPRSVRGWGEAETRRLLYPSFSGVYPSLTKRLRGVDAPGAVAQEERNLYEQHTA